MNIDRKRLPEGVEPGDLAWLVAPEIWARDFDLALSLALARFGRCDAERYMSENADVAKAGFGAEEHFSRFGWKEGRVLRLRKEFQAPGGQATQAAPSPLQLLEKQVAELRAENAMLLEHLHSAQEELDKHLRGLDE